MEYVFGGVTLFIVGVIFVLIKSLKKSIQAENENIQSIKQQLENCDKCSHLVESL
ncbi:hypothetical protein [Paenibacillus sp. FSL H7-0326]|uniref:hypothetical protein n=1 Tax=Paenibacillus sp. FSL H7-0326 TaxID=1921144 RepID=UPI0015C3BA74|nr:hypothetical protein [Paenibacillus sp. FSL H7-0326]